MKKNKNKSAVAAADNSAPEAVKIAPEALTNLADRLKLDLAKSQTQLPNQSSPKGSAGNGKSARTKDTLGFKNTQDRKPKANPPANKGKPSPGSKGPAKSQQQQVIAA